MDKPGRRAVRQLSVARVISASGTWAGGLALPFALYNRTHSGLWVAASWVITFGITGAFSPVAGHLADRYDRRLVMIVSDLVSAAAWGAMAVIHEPVAMLAIAFVATAGSQPFWAASGAAVPNLVPEEDLPWANATLGAASSIAALAGPAIGGVIIAKVGANATFSVDAVTYLLEAVFVATIAGRFSADRPEKEEARGGMLEGFRFIFGNPFLRASALVWTMQYFAIDAALVADPPLVKLFAVGAVGYGAMNAGWGAGGLGGSLLSRRLRKDRLAAAVAAGSITTAICYGLVALTPWFAPIILLMFMVSFADAFNTVAGQTLVQARTPDEVRGRTWAALGGLGMAANTVAFMSAGFLVNFLGPRAVYALGAGAAVLSFPFLGALSRNLRAELESTP